MHLHNAATRSPKGINLSRKVIIKKTSLKGLNMFSVGGLKL